jgi:hypothetical protein
MSRNRNHLLQTLTSMNNFTETEGEDGLECLRTLYVFPGLYHEIPGSKGESRNHPSPLLLSDRRNPNVSKGDPNIIRS